MFRNYLLRLKAAHLRAIREQKGQSIIIFTFAFLGLVAMLGLALDLGMVYIEKVKVSRTADAAALAAVVELPFEEEAMRRAIEYIQLNGYNVGQDTEVLVRGCIDTTPFVGGPGLRNVDANGWLNPTATVPVTPTAAMTAFRYIPSIEIPPRATFVIDTLAYQPVEFTASNTISTTNKESCDGDTPLYGTANKLRVTGRVNVNMSFMQFFGFGKVPVQDQAVGENVTNLDVAVVFDVSGSMDFETTCFGCWRKDPTLSANIMVNPYPTNGTYYPLTSTTTIGPACTSDPTPTTSGTNKYLVHEAELYSRNVPLNGWEFEKRVAGQGYWVLQRDIAGTSTSGQAYIRAHGYVTYSQSDINKAPQIQGAAYNIECFSGATLSNNCWATRAATLGEQAPSDVPWVEYNFKPNWTGSTYVWVRAQAGTGVSKWATEWHGKSPANNSAGERKLTDYRQTIFWQIDNNNVQGGPGAVSSFPNLPFAGGEDQPNTGSWRWLKLGSAPTSNGVWSVLKLYQGSSGFMVDKIIFTDDSTGSVGDTQDQLSNGTLKTLLTSNSGKGPAATPGSATREACNLCNPEFGQQSVVPNQCSCKNNRLDTAVSGAYLGGGSGLGCNRVLTTTNMLGNDLFADQAPLRNAQEAVKNFAKRLDPKFDQIGFVTFSSNVFNTFQNRAKLQCLRWAAKNSTGANACYDPASNPISYTTVFQRIENQDNNGATNISEGMREGLEELGIAIPTYNPDVDSECSSGNSNGTTNDGHSCDRSGAARRILILMTDGSPNNNGGCPSSYQWRGTEGAGNDDYDCSIWYAYQAANNNVAVYTIGIGAGANASLLQAMATGTDPLPDPNDAQKGFYFEGKGGRYYPAAKPSDLDQIFTDILGNVFVRIIG